MKYMKGSCLWVDRCPFPRPARTLNLLRGGQILGDIRKTELPRRDHGPLVAKRTNTLLLSGLINT